MTPEVKERIEQIRNGIVPEGYKKTVAGIMPKTWRQVRIGDVCIVNPLRPKKQEERVTFLGMADVSEEGRLINPSIVDCTKVSKGFTPFERGDILVAKITPCFENGKGADTSDLPTRQGYGSTEFHVLRCKDIDRQYMFLHTTSYEFRRKLESEMTGSAGQKRVQTESVASYLIGLPSADEQQRIAEILTVQDKAIELKEKLVVEKRQQKKYLMQQILSGKKRLPGFTGSWKMQELSSVIIEVNERSRVNNQYPILSSTTTGVMLSTDYYSHRQRASKDNTGYKVLRKNQLVFSPQNIWLGNINVNLTFDIGIVSPSYRVFDFYGDNDPKFWGYMFKTHQAFQKYETVLSSGASVCRKNLDSEAFLKLPFVVPSANEQKAIAGVLDNIDKEIELLRQDLEQEKQKKKALMQLLLTGIVRVNA